MYQKTNKQPLKFSVLAETIVFECCRILSNEDIVKKRSRWLGAESCARLVNDFCDMVNFANEIKVTNKQEFEARHAAQSKAIALLNSVAISLTRCLRMSGLDKPKLIGFGNMVNDELKLLRGWQRSDEKRYPQYFDYVRTAKDEDEN